MLGAMENTKFHGKAQAYAAARPGYPKEVMRYIASLMPSDAVVADIGAGTGKFTVPLAQAGFEVLAVEPDADMRGELAVQTAAYRRVTVIDGSASHTGLSDHSVDAITCAQALHWFDHDEFLAECRRISRGGTFLLVSVYNSTSFDSAMTIGHDGDPSGAADGAASGDPAHQPDPLACDRADMGVSARHFKETTAEFFRHPQIREFPNPIHYTRDSWREYMDSHSHSPLPTDPAYPAHRAWVDAIFDRHGVDGIMTDDNVCMVASEIL